MRKRTITSALVCLTLAFSLVLAACGGSTPSSTKSESETGVYSQSEQQTPEAKSIASKSSTKSPAKDETNPKYQYSQAFASYLKILKDYEKDIRGYDWQEGYLEKTGEGNRPVAVADIVGDETPELIFMKKYPLDNIGAKMASLHIFTYTGGKAVCLMSRQWDVQVGAGMKWMICNMNDTDFTQRIMLYFVNGDEALTYRYEYFGLGDSDILVPYGSFSEHRYPLNNESQTMGEKFTIDDEEASRENFDAAFHDFTSNVKEILMLNDGQHQTEPLKVLMENRDNVSMTFDEASAFLNDGILQGEKASEVVDTYGFILPNSDKRVYTRDELKYFSDEELSKARNEVYARHGRKFSDTKWNIYFSSFLWYSPKYSPEDFDARDDILNEYEKKNVKLILEIEAERASGNSGSSANSGNDGSGEGTPARPGTSGDLWESQFVTNMDHFSFKLPYEWRDKVTVNKVNGSRLVICANDPAGFELCTIETYDASTPYNAGDVLNHCVWHKDTSTGKRVEVWCMDYGYVFWYEFNGYDENAGFDTWMDDFSTMKDVNEQKLLTLQGGNIDLNQLRADKYPTSTSTYLKGLMDVAITLY